MIGWLVGSTLSASRSVPLLFGGHLWWGGPDSAIGSPRTPPPGPRAFSWVPPGSDRRLTSPPRHPAARPDRSSAVGWLVADCTLPFKMSANLRFAFSGVGLVLVRRWEPHSCGGKRQVCGPSCSSRFMAEFTRWRHRYWTALVLDSERFLDCLLVSGLHQLAVAGVPPPPRKKWRHR